VNYILEETVITIRVLKVLRKVNVTIALAMARGAPWILVEEDRASQLTATVSV
jgi:hypothetical protein